MYSIGKVIKAAREKKKISQEELCFGLCSVSTLSRIENNEQVPTMEKALALMERLGLEGSVYLGVVSEKDLAYHRMCKHIKGLMSDKKIEEAYYYLQKNMVDFEKNCFRKQFFLSVEATKACMIDKKYDLAITLTQEAIKMTCPNFNSKSIEKNLLTDVEIEIINVMAISYWNCDRHLEAVNLLIKVVDSLYEVYGDDCERKYLLPMLICNLSKWLCMMYRLEEAAHYADLGIKICGETNRYKTLPFHLCNKASLEWSINKDYDRTLSLYQEAYTLFNKMHLLSEADELRNFVINNFNRDLSRTVILEPINNPR